jgi:hypothetical protein
VLLPDGSIREIAAEPSEYRAPHRDFGSCREIGAKTHWGSTASVIVGVDVWTSLYVYTCIIVLTRISGRRVTYHGGVAQNIAKVSGGATGVSVSN